jgi:hypothetical protein
MKLFLTFVFWGLVHDMFVSLRKFNKFVDQIDKVSTYAYHKARVDEANAEMDRIELEKIVYRKL